MSRYAVERYGRQWAVIAPGGRDLRPWHRTRKAAEQARQEAERLAAELAAWEAKQRARREALGERIGVTAVRAGDLLRLPHAHGVTEVQVVQVRHGMSTNGKPYVLAFRRVPGGRLDPLLLTPGVEVRRAE